jgi:hypothetical protein
MKLFVITSISAIAPIRLSAYPMVIIEKWLKDTFAIRIYTCDDKFD